MGHFVSVDRQTGYLCTSACEGGRRVRWHQFVQSIDQASDRERHHCSLSQDGHDGHAMPYYVSGQASDPQYFLTGVKNCRLFRDILVHQRRVEKWPFSHSPLILDCFTVNKTYYVEASLQASPSH